MVGLDFSDECPTTKNAFGEDVPSPAFVFVVCDECQKEGYVPDAAADVAYENDEPLVCSGCFGEENHE